MKKQEEIKSEIEAGIENCTICSHHTSLFRGYVSRRCEGVYAPYNGRFGVGYTLRSPNWKSSVYSHVTYFIVIPPDIAAQRRAQRDAYISKIKNSPQPASVGEKPSNFFRA